MKLKKIASLALAGVMAVSMLAGCATTKPETKPEDPTETSSISKEVGALIKDVPSYVTFEDSTSLDAGLKKAVEYAGVTDVMPGYVYYDTLANVQADVAARLGIKTSSATDKTGTYDLSIYDVSNDGKYCIGEQRALAAAELGVTTNTLPSATVTDMFAVSTAVGENAVKQMVAEKLADVADYGYSVANNDTDKTQGNFNYTYTVSVSTCTKAVNSSINGSNNGFQGAADPSVTFVAVQVVRTATHQ